MVSDLTLELSVPRRRRPRLRGVVVHRPGDTETLRPSVVRGIPVTDPLRALLDLAAVAAPETVAEALERALSCRLVSVKGVVAELERSTRPGRTGSLVLRRVLANRALWDRPPDSVLEPKFAALLRRRRVVRPVFQHVVRHEGRFVGRVDFAWPEHHLAVEVDGHDTHRTPTDLQRDLTRQNRLVAAGWTVLRFTWSDVVSHPDEVAATVRRQLSPPPRAPEAYPW
jgi:very-short-patch-repair endonuclease